MTIKHNGKPGVPQSYKDVTQKLKAVGEFNVGTKFYKSNPKHQK